MANKRRWNLTGPVAVLLFAAALAAHRQGAPLAAPSPEQLLRQK